MKTAVEPMGIEIQQHRFTVDDFHRMTELGILEPDMRVELLDGRIYEMASVNSPHAACVDRLSHLLMRRWGDEVIVRVQGPVRISRYTEPLPDIALLRGRDDFYAANHPQPRDILLLIEVADTTLLRDRKLKVPLYGRGGVAECWLVDLNARRIEVYRDPTPEAGYREATVVGEARSLAATKLPDLRLEVSAILP